MAGYNRACLHQGVLWLVDFQGPAQQRYHQGGVQEGLKSNGGSISGLYIIF